MGNPARTRARITEEDVEAESEIPMEFSLQSEEDASDLPLRLLDDFVVYGSTAKTSQMQPLESLDVQGHTPSLRLVAEGRVVCPSRTGAHVRNKKVKAKTMRVSLTEVTEWCIDYSQPPSIWLLTNNAWYKLLSPSPEYADVFSTTRRKFDLCVRTAALLRSNPTVTYAKGFQSILVAGSTDEVRYTEEDLGLEAGFVLAQLEAAAEADAADEDFGDFMLHKALGVKNGLVEYLRRKHAAVELICKKKVAVEEASRRAKTEGRHRTPTQRYRDVAGNSTEQAKKITFTFKPGSTGTDVKDQASPMERIGGGRNRKPSQRFGEAGENAGEPAKKIKITFKSGVSKDKYSQQLIGQQSVVNTSNVGSGEASKPIKITFGGSEVLLTRGKRTRGATRPRVSDSPEDSTAPRLRSRTKDPSNDVENDSGEWKGSDSDEEVAAPKSRNRSHKKRKREEWEDSESDQAEEVQEEDSEEEFEEDAEGNDNEIENAIQQVASEDEYEPAVVSEDEAEEDDEYVEERAAPNQAKFELAEQIAKSREKARLEAEDRALLRPRPPPLERGLLVDFERSGDVIMIWDFLRSFPSVFPKLKPFPLWRLEAALAPELQVPELTWLPDVEEVKLRSGNAATPSKLGQASSLVLRDVHLALVSVVEEAYGHERTPSRQDRWPTRAARAIINQSRDVEAHAVEHAWQLKESAGEYALLHSFQRIAILQALIQLVVSTDMLREIMNHRIVAARQEVDAMLRMAQQQREAKARQAAQEREARARAIANERMASARAAQDEDYESRMELGAEGDYYSYVYSLSDAAPILPPPSASTQSLAAQLSASGEDSEATEIIPTKPMDWGAWVAMHTRLPGQPLGRDGLRRRYWLFGSPESGERIYVEGADGVFKGYYPRSSLGALLDWMDPDAPVVPPEESEDAPANDTTSIVPALDKSKREKIWEAAIMPGMPRDGEDVQFIGGEQELVARLRLLMGLPQIPLEEKTSHKSPDDIDVAHVETDQPQDQAENLDDPANIQEEKPLNLPLLVSGSDAMDVDEAPVASASGLERASSKVESTHDGLAVPVVSLPKVDRYAKPSVEEKLEEDPYRKRNAPMFLGVEETAADTGMDMMKICVEALLGAMPFWLWRKTGLDMMGNTAVMLNAAETPAQMGAVLSITETLLQMSGCMGETWTHSLAAQWRLMLPMCTGHTLIAQAIVQLQSHVNIPEDWLSRKGFARLAIESGCSHFHVPKLGDEVVLLRRGYNQHREAYAVEVPSLPSMDSIAPTERFRVEGMAFRRSRMTLAHGEETAPLQCWLLVCQLVATPRTAAAEIQAHIAASSSEGGASASGAASLRRVCVPLHLEDSLPEYIIPAKVFDASMERSWEPGDMFKMYFATGEDADGNATGCFYKGKVVRVDPARDPDGRKDPWESVVVSWASEDFAASEESSCDRISPWEMELDEEEMQRVQQEREAEIMKNAADAQIKEQAQAAELQMTMAMQLARQQQAFMTPASVATPPPPLATSATKVPKDPKTTGIQLYPNRNATGDQKLSRRAGRQEKGTTRGANGRVAVPDEESFMDALEEFTNKQGFKFRVPTFCHVPLNMHRVFASVQQRGGYNIVTENKQWKDVCRMLELDLTGQTSASFSMRNIYERMLLPFECHLESIHGTISGPDAGNPYHNDNGQVNAAEADCGGEHLGDNQPVCPAGDGTDAGALSNDAAAAASSTPAGPATTNLDNSEVTPAPTLGGAGDAPMEQESDTGVEPHTLATPAGDADAGGVQTASKGRDVGEGVEAVTPIADDRAQDQSGASTASVKVGLEVLTKEQLGGDDTAIASDECDLTPGGSGIKIQLKLAGSFSSADSADGVHDEAEAAQETIPADSQDASGARPQRIKVVRSSAEC